MGAVSEPIILDRTGVAIADAIAALPNATQAAADAATAAATAATEAATNTNRVNIAMTKNDNVLNVSVTNRSNQQTTYSITDPIGTVAEEFVATKGYEVGDVVVQNGVLYKFTAAHPAGAWIGTDAEETNFNDVLNSSVSQLNIEITESEKKSMLLNDIPDTEQTIQRGSDGKVSGILHTRDGSTVRTDTFVFGSGTVTETRTLDSGETLTIVVNKTTKVTTITYTAA